MLIHVCIYIYIYIYIYSSGSGGGRHLGQMRSPFRGAPSATA